MLGPQPALRVEIFSASDCKAGEGETGNRSRTSIVSPYCSEMEARVRLYAAASRPSFRFRNCNSMASMCLQVPSVLTAKSGQSNSSRTDPVREWLLVSSSAGGLDRVIAVRPARGPL